MLNRFSNRAPVTIAQVARAAGVSKATVSLVLNGQQARGRISAATRESVSEWALRLGYVPNQAARSLRRRRSNAITLLVWRLSSAYFTEIAYGVRSAAEQAGYEVQVVDAGPVDAEVRALRQLRTGASDGVIVATGYHTTRGPAVRALRDLARQGAPLVMLLDHPPDPRVPAIRIDDEGGAYIATRHLLTLGHRRIGHISVNGGRLDEDDESPQYDRFAGFTKALEEAGVRVDRRAIVQGPGLMAGGRASALKLLGRFRSSTTRPTALFVYNDLAAIGVLRALYELGIRVPDDIAIVGFHGLELGQFTTPSLTTIAHPLSELGEMGAQRLLRMIQEPDHAAEAEETVLPVELVVRESCGGASG